MKNPLKYKTKQSIAILEYLESINGAHVTVGQIKEYFSNNDICIGTTTIYRNLDKLMSQGKVKKYYLNNFSGACYQYIDNSPKTNHYHFICEKCNRIIHIQCDMLDEANNHINSSHNFDVNKSKTIFYGTCENCINK